MLNIALLIHWFMFLVDWWNHGMISWVFTHSLNHRYLLINTLIVFEWLVLRLIPWCCDWFIFFVNMIVGLNISFIFLIVSLNNRYLLVNCEPEQSIFIGQHIKDLVDCFCDLRFDSLIDDWPIDPSIHSFIHIFFYGDSLIFDNRLFHTLARDWRFFFFLSLTYALIYWLL